MCECVNASVRCTFIVMIIMIIMIITTGDNIDTLSPLLPILALVGKRCGPAATYRLAYWLADRHYLYPHPTL